MEINQNNIDNLNATLEIKVSPEDYSEKFEAALKKYRKQVNLPGFRPGKVPMGLVKKQYGRSILAEEIYGILDAGINDHIQTNELKVLGRPMPSEDKEVEGDWDNPGDFAFTYEIGLSPSVEVKVGKKAMEYLQIEVSDEMVADQIKDMTRRYGSLETPEESADQDMMMVSLVELDDKGEIKEGGIMNDATIGLEFIEDKKTKKALTGMKTGMTADVDPHKIAKNHDDLGRILGISHEEVHDLKSNFKLTVNDVKRLIPAELNEELFKKAFPTEEIADEASFKDKIKADLENMFKADAENLFRRKFAKQLIEDINPALPDAFLKKWIKMANEKPLSEEQLEADYPNYAENLKWQLIQNQVIEDEKLEVTAEELKEHAGKYIERNYKQYGMTLDAEQLDSMVTSTIANAEERQRLFETLYEHKVVDALKEKAKIKEKKVSYEKFIEEAQSM